MNSRIIIAGGRHFNNYDIFESFVNDVITEKTNPSDNIEIISGHCAGVDKMGEKYAEENDIKCIVFPAEWNKYGKSAGIKRNAEMISYASQCEKPILIAFWDSESHGTKYTIDNATKRGFDVNVYKYSLSHDYVRYLPDIENMSEGVRKNGNNFDFDFDNDDSDDIVKLNIDKIHRTSKNRHTYYYGYKVNLDPKIANDRKDFLWYIKTESGLSDANVEEMIKLCIEHFTEDVNMMDFDCIIAAPSHSKLVDILTNSLVEGCNIPIVTLDKIDVNDVHWDIDKTKTFSPKLMSYLNKMLASAQKKTNDKFSISKSILPRYRKYLSPLMQFKSDDDIVAIEDAKNILIVDDTLTTGKSFDDIISLMNKNGYNGNITIFSLIRNY